jgi:hypothetical protein
VLPVGEIKDIKDFKDDRDGKALRSEGLLDVLAVLGVFYCS